MPLPMGPRTAVRTSFNGARNDIRSILGSGGHYIIDCSSEDKEVPTAFQNHRYFEVDVEGVIKFTYIDDEGNEYTVVMTAIKGRNLYSRITDVFKEYADSTSCTAQVYNSSGALVTGIRLVL